MSTFKSWHSSYSGPDFWLLLKNQKIWQLQARIPLWPCGLELRGGIPCSAAPGVTVASSRSRSRPPTGPAGLRICPLPPPRTGIRPGLGSVRLGPRVQHLLCQARGSEVRPWPSGDTEPGVQVGERGSMSRPPWAGREAPGEPVCPTCGDLCLQALPSLPSVGRGDTARNPGTFLLWDPRLHLQE